MPSGRFKPRMITVRGITDTPKGHARRVGRSYNTIKQRLRRMDAESALYGEIPERGRAPRSATLYTVRGITDTLQGHARRAGRSYHTVYNRKSRMDIEQALYGPLREARQARQARHIGKTRPIRFYTVRGITDSLTGHCRRAERNRTTVELRMKHMDLEEALYGRLKKVSLYTVQGITDTIKGHARRVGCCPATIYNRMKRMPLEDALYPPRHKSQNGGS